MLGERVRGPLDHGRDVRAPDIAGAGELLGEPRRDPAGALAGLDEFARRERPLSQQREQVGVDSRPGGFHQVERERRAAFPVGVEDAEAGIEPERVAGEDRLGFEQRRHVVEDRVRGVGRHPWPAGQERCALSEHPPVLG